MSNETQPEGAKDWTSDDESLEVVATTPSASEGASVFREVARLHQDIKSAKQRARRTTLIIVLLIIAHIISIAAWLNYPKYRFIATLDNRAICEVPTKDNPTVTPEVLLQWSADAVVELYSIDYINYRSELQKAARKWLSKKGQRSFFLSLDGSKNLQLIRQERLITKAVINQVPQLEQEGMYRDTGEHYWEVRMPVIVEFYANGNRTPVSSSQFLVSVQIIQSEATAFNQRGLAIQNILLKPYIPPKD